jgi:hypothetical protein
MVYDMKKILMLCAAMVAMAFGASAQIVDTTKDCTTDTIVAGGSNNKLGSQYELGTQLPEGHDCHKRAPHIWQLASRSSNGNPAYSSRHSSQHW